MKKACTVGWMAKATAQKTKTQNKIIKKLNNNKTFYQLFMVFEM